MSTGRVDPGKAAAWARELGIAPASIAGYVATLTPVLLTDDTLVGNHAPGPSV